MKEDPVINYCILLLFYFIEFRPSTPEDRANEFLPLVGFEPTTADLPLMNDSDMKLT